MSALSFRDYTLREAEGALVHRCLTDEALLKTALHEMPHDCLRTDSAFSLIFYSLYGMCMRGVYDSETNEDYMAFALAALEWRGKDLKAHRGEPLPELLIEDWRRFVADLWDGNTAMPEVSTALIADLVEEYRRQDEKVRSIREGVFYGPFAVDADEANAVYLRLRHAVLNERAQRLARPIATVPTPVRPDWEGIRKRVAS